MTKEERNRIKVEAAQNYNGDFDVQNANMDKVEARALELAKELIDIFGPERLEPTLVGLYFYGLRDGYNARGRINRR